MSVVRAGRSAPADLKKSGTRRFLLLSMVVWTILMAAALAIVFGDVRLPLDLADPYISVSCFLLLWLVGLLSLRILQQRLTHDVQYRHCINAQVLKAKNEWEATFDALPNPVAIIDRKYTIMRANRAMADKIGLDVRECIGKKCYEYMHGTNAPPPGCPQRSMLKTGCCVSNEIHDDKMGGDFVMSVAPLYEDGEIRGGIHFIYDITHRKNVEQELRRNEARNRSILEAVGEGVCGLDMEGTVIFVNPVACALLGYSAADLIGRNLHRMVHCAGEDGAVYSEENCRVLQAMRNNEAVKVDDDIFRRRDGSRFPVEFTASPVHENGRQAGCVLVFDDISERKKGEAERLAFTGRYERRKRFRSLNVMAGGIAHNFNNILMAVLGNIELLLYSLPESNCKEREFATAAMEASRRAADFSTMMLWYVGQGNIERQIINMRHVMEAVREQLGPDDLQQCTIKVDVGTEAAIFEGDEVLVRQIIINLVKNAVEAMSQKPSVVELRVGRRSVAVDELGGVYMDGSLLAGDYIFLEVIDCGVGMNQDDLEYIFEPFYTTKFTGRGLGLPFILGIMRSHNGGVVINSELGVGTTATILFPAVAGSGAALPVAAGGLATAAGDEYQGVVLFVDDEETLRECNRSMLQLIGFEVLTAGDGPEALAIYRQNKGNITLVLLDIGLPGMDGFEVLARLKEIDPAVRVIIHSGFPRDVVEEKIEPGEIAGYIQEPFNMDELRQALNLALADKGP